MRIVAETMLSIRVIRNSLLLAILLFSVVGPGLAQENSNRPNVILFLADDLGSGDLGFAGHPYVKTPHLDAFATQSLAISNGYSAGTWCSPSRYALMRGQYPGRGFYRDLTLNPDEPTIASFLKTHGYTTAHIGKWHLKGKAFADYGFDFHFAVNGPENSVKKPGDKTFRATSTEIFVDHAIAFIEDAGEQPFYLNLWAQPTHSYIDPLPEQLAIYDGLEVDIDDFDNPHQRSYLKFIDSVGDLQAAMQAYCADVTELDKQFGRLMAHLDSAGLAENTIVLFTSDNGPGPLHRQTEDTQQLLDRYVDFPTLINMVGSASKFRDRKSSIREGGIRVPYVVRFPNRIPAGKVDEESIVSGVDWFSTIADYLDEDMPEGHRFDGQSVKAVYEGRIATPNRMVHWYETRNAIAIRNGRYKLLNYSGKPNSPLELYDLVNDPGESKDLSKVHPERFQSMLRLLEEWRAQTVRQPPPVRLP